MSRFCDKCGQELKNENSRFCDKCGAELRSQSTSSQTFDYNFYQENHSGAVIVGYICTILVSLLIPLIGLIIAVIFAVYLFTRNNNEELKKHGIIMILIPIVMWIISILILLFIF